MDGAFKTVHRLFTQLYTIHAAVGNEDNSMIFSLAYALMTSKSEEMYIRLFQKINETVDNAEIELNPLYIMTDFELGAINAARREFQGVTTKCCNFHQFIDNIQQFGLVQMYGTDINFAHLITQLSALAYLTPQEIPDAFDNLS